MNTILVVLIVLQDILTIFVIRSMKAENFRITLENDFLKIALDKITEEINRIGSEINEKNE